MTARRIHFLEDVSDHGAAYECQRCGYTAATKIEIKWHRDGFLLSACERARLKQWLATRFGN